jgi:hypothetical protein
MRQANGSTGLSSLTALLNHARRFGQKCRYYNIIEQHGYLQSSLAKCEDLQSETIFLNQVSVVDE